MLNLDIRLHRHSSDGQAACWKLLQESRQALQAGDDQLALMHAEHAVRVGQQEVCAECLGYAFWHLGYLCVQRRDYARAAASFTRAQQLAQEGQDEAMVKLITASHQLCLVLGQVALAGRWLSQFHGQLRQRLTIVDQELHTALTMIANDQFAELSDGLYAPTINNHPSQSDGLGSREPVSLPEVDFVIRCLGSFAVYHNGQPISFPRNRKADVVLKYLVLHRDRPVSRDALMELGWPDAGLDVAGNNLNTTISIVRSSLARALERQIQGSPILCEDGHYCLNPVLTLSVDVAEFDACWKRGLACERDGRVGEAMEAYQAAVALYHGDLLMGDLYDDRIVIERERLATTFLMLLSKLGEYRLGRGDYQEAMDYAHRLLEQDPCREDAHRLLMHCFARLGQRVQALRQYELCQSLLRRELNIEPAPETMALRERIAQGESV